MQQSVTAQNARASDKSFLAAILTYARPWLRSSHPGKFGQLLPYLFYTLIQITSALPTEGPRPVDPLWKGLSLSWELAGTIMIAIVAISAVGRLSYAIWRQTNATPPRYSDVATFTIAASFPAFLFLEPDAIKLHCFVLACWGLGLIHTVANWCFIVEHPRDYFCRSCLGGFPLYAVCRFYDLDNVGAWPLEMQYVAGMLCITLVMMVLPYGRRWTNQI